MNRQVYKFWEIAITFLSNVPPRQFQPSCSIPSNPLLQASDLGISIGLQGAQVFYLFEEEETPQNGAERIERFLG